MATIAARVCESESVPEQAIEPASLIIAEKREAIKVEHDGRLGWREYLRRLGVDAAIILCELRGAETGRRLFFVGLDEARGNVQLTDGLIAYAEGLWRNHPRSAFESLGQAIAITGGVRPAQGHQLSRLLADYAHIAVMHASQCGDGVSAVFLTKTQPFDTGISHRLSEALPLFHDGARAHARSDQAQVRAAQLTAMLDQVSLATFLVNPNGRAVFVNSVAQQMLSERRFLMQQADGRLACPDSLQTKGLRAAIRAAATAAPGAGEQFSIRLGQIEGDWRLAVVVPADPLAGDEQLRCAMIVVHGPQQAEVSTHLLKALGLLPSEQRFLAAFLKTSSLAEAAKLSGLSEESARTYLKRVRSKLGVHRQFELARLIYGLAPPIRFAQQQAAE